MKNLCG